MQVNSISNTVISTLGNPSSLIPLAIKDVINSAGITYFSYDAGGKLEGKDRFIDEFGTQFIWLFGLPLFKKLANKTFYKMKNLNPEVDVRVAKSEAHVDFARKILNTSEQKEAKDMLSSLNNAVKRLPEFKKLFYSKFALATTLTLASYFALTKFKHHTTEKAIIKDYLAEKKQEKEQEKLAKSFKAFQPLTAKPSFKGLESFMFNPVKNLMIIDAGITTERLTKSRNKHEFAEYAIKEGSFLFFMYAAGSWIQKGLQKFSEKVLKTPIDLDLRFINSDKLKQTIETDTLKQEIQTVLKLNSEKEILDFIAKNPGSAITEGAKISGIISTFKNGDINPSKYINTKEITNLAKSLEKLINSAKNSKKPIDKFLKQARNHKISAIIANIGISCLALGYVMPKIIYGYRQKQSGSSSFHVKDQIRSKLDQTFSGDKI